LPAAVALPPLPPPSLPPPSLPPPSLPPSSLPPASSPTTAPWTTFDSLDPRDLLGDLPSLELPPPLNHFDARGEFGARDHFDAGGEFGARGEDARDEHSRYSDAGYSDAHLHDDPYGYMPPELRPSSQSSSVLPAVPVYVIGRSMFETSGIPSGCAAALPERAPARRSRPPPAARARARARALARAAAVRPRTERVADQARELRRLKMRPGPHLAR
jgi:hypothetical protein